MTRLAALLSAVLIAVLPAGQATAQSSVVTPGELSLTVELEEREHIPFVREMALITIRGQYRRHITLETLRQPDLEGFNWSQLGPDKWTEERIGGQRVKVFERRMAVYPDRPGRLTIGAFTHHLTLTDESDDWFDHEISSEPLTIDVAPQPATDGWWFPTRSLRVSDQWSNAPALLKPGEGVLRVVRLEALGVTPEMIPPMPELTSPSAMIFPHPEKRLAQLSPEGPVTYAFWRWTIRPTNDISTIVEPLTFSYYDTTARAHRSVTISAQRIAYGDLVPDARPAAGAAPGQARLPGAPEAVVAALVFALGIGAVVWGREMTAIRGLGRVPLLDPSVWRLRLAARRGDAVGMRRAALEMIDRGGGDEDAGRLASLHRLDAAIYGPKGSPPDLAEIARNFLRRTP